MTKKPWLIFNTLSYDYINNGVIKYGSFRCFVDTLVDKGIPLWGVGAENVHTFNLVEWDMLDTIIGAIVLTSDNGYLTRNESLLLCDMIWHSYVENIFVVGENRYCHSVGPKVAECSSCRPNVDPYRQYGCLFRDDILMSIKEGVARRKIDRSEQ